MKNAFKYEVKKVLRSKTIIILFALLLAFNVVIGFFTLVENKASGQEQFDKDIQKIVYMSEVNLSFISNKGSENARYQKNVIERYEGLKGLMLSEGGKGFESLLSSPYPYLSSLIFGIWVAMQLALSEHSSSIVLLSFKEKRKTLAFSKIIVAACSAVFSMFTFCVCYSIAILASGGFAGGLAPIQSILTYIHCPYKISVIEALGLRFLFAAIFAVLASFIVYTASLIIKKFIPSLLAIVAFIGLDFLLVSASTDIFDIFYNFNFRTFITGTWLERYSGLKIFVFLSQPVFASIVLTILIAVFTFISYFVFKRTSCIRSIKTGKFLSQGSHRKHGLNFYELKKMFRGKTIIVAVILLVFKMVFLYMQVNTPNGAYDKVYKNYLGEMQEMTYEKQGIYIDKELANNNLILKKAEELTDKVIYDTATDEEYEQYLEYCQLEGAARLKVDVLEDMQDQLYSVALLREKGIDAKLIYTTGWNELFSLSSDFFCVLTIVFVLIPYATIDDESKFNPILNGFFLGKHRARRRFDFRKNILMYVFSALVTLIFMFTDIFFISTKVGLPSWSEYAVGTNLPMAAQVMTLWQIVLLRSALSLVAAAMLVVIINILGIFIHNSMLMTLLFIFVEFLCIVVSKLAKIFFAFDFSVYFGYGAFRTSWYWVLIQTVGVIAIIVTVLVLHEKSCTNSRKKGAVVEE